MLQNPKLYLIENNLNNLEILSHTYVNTFKILQFSHILKIYSKAEPLPCLFVDPAPSVMPDTLHVLAPAPGAESDTPVV